MQRLMAVVFGVALLVSLGTALIHMTNDTPAANTTALVTSGQATVSDVADTSTAPDTGSSCCAGTASCPYAHNASAKTAHTVSLKPAPQPMPVATAPEPGEVAKPNAAKPAH